MKEQFIYRLDIEIKKIMYTLQFALQRKYLQPNSTSWIVFNFIPILDHKTNFHFVNFVVASHEESDM